MDFTGKTAISTGAASGMGLLFAQNFAELGGNVILCDVNEEVLNKCVEEINSKGKDFNLMRILPGVTSCQNGNIDCYIKNIISIQ